MSASPVTPLDYIAAGYWQDFLAKRPIAGGIAYETELRDCVLDESLASLQRVDMLLSQLRRNMIKADQWNEQALLVDERHRNFMMFLAFYAGRVLAKQWQSTPHWYGQFELRKRYPELSLVTDDFYQHMAVNYRDNTDNSAVASLFFALEPIGLRLFGHIDRQFAAVQGGQVASGLYQAVSAKLPNDRLLNNRLPNNSDDQVTESATHSDIQNTDSSTDVHLNTSEASTIQKPFNDIGGKEVSAASDLSENNKLERAKAETLLTNRPSEQLVITKPASAPKTSPTPEMFTQLLVELDDIAVEQSAGNTEYQQANNILAQFERHIAKQNKPRAQVVFSEKHLAAKKQALLALQEAANAGHTAAMLRLAMYELLGEGLAVDKVAGTASGVEWVKQAASQDDSRAQRLLSKMYYQGLGVSQDIDNGKYWLTQAAKNGHAEAADLVAHWQQAQVLMTTKKQEQHSIKRYQILLGVVGVIALLILIFV
ncbi:tetratricopeptide repeat protein [Psychrobacter namhaensis]|uniref:tetratricopeptide repeat protein n=1 Tax=Psychrobacter namhaensis TaxID=292734 RepID=UPI003D01F76A